MINHKEVKQKDLEIFNEIQINKELNYKNEDLNMYEIETKKNFLHRRMQTFLASATIMLDSRPVPSSKKKGSLKRKRDNQKGSKKKKLVETFAHRMLKFIRFQKDHPVFVIDLMKEEKSPKNLKTEQIIYKSVPKREGSAKFEKLSNLICYLKTKNPHNKSVLIFINDIRFTKVIKQAMEQIGFTQVK